MIFLIFSILASVSVAILLKIARQRNWLISQMVAVNYVIATVLTLIFLQPKMNLLSGQFVGLWVILGILLPTIFIAMGRAVAVAGIIKSDAAQRLSLFLPVLAAFTLFGEPVVAHRLLGLLTAVLALVCLLYQPTQHKATSHGIWWLLAVWLGYGTIDILFKQLSQQGAAFSGSLLMVFILSGILMMAYLLWQKTVWHKHNMMAGALLGCLNFMNIWFYIKAHQAFTDSPTLVFAGMNMGVIALGTLVGAWAFGERISKINALGVILAFLAVLCLYYGQFLFQAA